jgi:glycerol-3-phosphate dehydrogenase (NAD(P)+)
MPTFAILGSGGWGTAMAVLLARKPGSTVRLWCANPATSDDLQTHRENRRQLPGVAIPGSISITADPVNAVEGADAWVTAIPTAFLRSTIRRFQGLASHGIPVVSLTKGLEIATFQRPTEILAEELGAARFAVLSGPSHAEEVALSQPTSLVAASNDPALAAWIQRHCGGDRFRIYTSPDLVGVELAGALKNVMGIAAGICDGLGFGDNAKSALLTRGLVEMQRFGTAHGADPATFGGLAGLGDLITTCFSRHGRNRRAGERIAKGATLAEVTGGPQVAEGVFTAKSVYERAMTAGLDVPICAGVYRILYEGRPAREAVEDLLGRPPKPERLGEG